MNVLFAGGGTGGHLYPGLALADALRSLVPDGTYEFIGTQDGLDDRIVPRDGYAVHLIGAGRGSPIRKDRLSNAPRFMLALAQCRKLLRAFRPDVLVALGGFAAAAPGIMARWLHVPVILLEQNAVPGRANRLLSKWAVQAHLQFRSAREWLRGSPASFSDLGSPLRSSLAALADEPVCKGESLLIMGGSQGAQSLNSLCIEASRTIVDHCGCSIIHLAGEGNCEAVAGAYREVGVEADVIGFCHSMESVYRRSRLAISRAGAGSLAELGVAGIPAVLIPLASAADDHQRKNGQELVARGAAEMLDPTGLIPMDLAAAVCDLWADRARRDAMAEAMRRSARPTAAIDIARMIVDQFAGVAS